jgi:DNA-binding HxlR family transcriptional regulator
MSEYSSDHRCKGCICKPESGGVCSCHFEGVVELLGRRCGLLVFTIIGNFGTVRYSEIEKRLAGISPRTISDRLKELESAGLVKRKMYDEIPPRVEYSLTDTGAGLMGTLASLSEWASASGYVNRSRYAGPCPSAKKCSAEKRTNYSEYG